MMKINPKIFHVDPALPESELSIERLYALDKQKTLVQQFFGTHFKTIEKYVKTACAGLSKEKIKQRCKKEVFRTGIYQAEKYYLDGKIFLEVYPVFDDYNSNALSCFDYIYYPNNAKR